MCVHVLFLVMSPEDAELMLAELYLSLLTQKDGWMKVVSNGKSCCLTNCRGWWLLFELCSFIAIQIVSNFHTFLWESLVLKRYNKKYQLALELNTRELKLLVLKMKKLFHTEMYCVVF